jgi:phospholipase/carboxylesterase
VVNNPTGLEIFIEARFFWLYLTGMKPISSLSLFHLVHSPQNSNSKHPAIVCLHGRGSNEEDLLGLAPYLDDRLLWISPRAPLDLMGGYEWYRLEGIGQPIQSTFDAAVATLDRFIAEVMQTYPVDPDKFFLLGFSQGSMMSYSFALTWPNRVTGVIVQSGYIPLSSGLKVDKAELKGKPFLITHGIQDPLIPVQWGREAHTYLQSVEADSVYHEFPMGHTVSEESLSVIDEWLRERIG